MKSHKSTDELIHELSTDLKPVQVISSPMRRWLSVMSVFLMVFGVAIVLLEFVAKKGMSHQNFTSSAYWVELLTILLLTLLASFSSLQSSIPGRSFKNGSRLATLLLILWLGFVALRWVLEPHSGGAQLHATLFCPISTFALGVALAFVLIREVSKGGMLNKKWTFATLWLSAGVLGSLIPHLFCSVRSEEHLLVFHILPVLALVLVGTFISLRTHNNTRQ